MTSGRRETSGNMRSSRRTRQGQNSRSQKQRRFTQSGSRSAQNRSQAESSVEKKIKSRYRRLKARRRKRQLRIAALLIICAGIVFGVIQLLLFLYVRKYDTGTILSGVYIGNLDVGGLTAAEVEEQLNQQIADYENGALELESGSNAQSITYGELGVTADTKKLAQEAADYGMTGSLFTRYRQIRKCEKENYVIPMQYTVDHTAAETFLNEQCAGFFDGPVNATLTRKSGEMVITEGKDGNALDVEATIEEITAFLNNGWNGEDGTVTVQSKTVEPEIQAKDLETVQDLLGTFTTYYGGAASGSIINIENGAGLINGGIVMPGEEYSADAAMRPYTTENGYTDSGAYEDGMLVQSMGGGICQVSTTLYNALLMAELEITERQPHSMLVDYVEPSMDAAIAGDIKDLKFRNNYDSPVYLECVMEDGYLTINVYGKEVRDEGHTVEYISEVTATEQPEGYRFVETDDYAGYYAVQSAAREGVSAQLWKVVYEDGTEVSREVINTSYYASAKTIIGVGTDTDNEAWKSAIQEAIATQDEETIRSVINSGGAGYQDSEEAGES